MKAFKLIAGMVVTAGAVVAINTATAGATAQNTKCDIPKLPWGAGAGEKMKVEGNKVTATYTVTGTNCTTDVTLAVWKTPAANGQPIYEQVFFGNTTQKNVAPGTHTITATLPDCYWQADLLVGSNPKAADGTAHYAYQNGEILKEHPLRDYKFGGDKKCTVPEQPTGGAGEGGPEVAAAVTELPKTGAGAIAATFAGVSASAGAAHAIVSRKKRQ